MDVVSLPASQQDLHEPSPTKRRKLDPLPLDATRPASNDDQQLFTLPIVSSDAPAASQVHPPRPAVPTNVALWAVASSLRQSARHLLPLLAKRPSSTSQKSQDRYSRTWASYVQQTAAAIAALRAAVLWTSRTSETKGTRTELRAQAMLAEALIETYEGSGDERKIQGEADSALTRALALASSHPSLSAYTTPLTLLHLRLALAVGKPLKYLKTTLKRALSSLPPPDSPLSRTGANLASSVQLALFGSRLEKEAPNEALAAWRNVKQVAQEVENRQLWVVATLAEARLGLLIEGDIVRAASLLAVVHGDLGGDATTATAGGEAWPPRQLRVMYRLVYCLVHSQLGNVKEAKDMLKATHSLLDAKMDAVEAARPDMIPIEISPSDGVQPTTITYFQVPTHAELYSYAFVISSIVHYDPMGKQPRAILFAEEGVRIFDGQLCGRDLPPAYRSVAEISTHLREAVGPAIRLRLDLAGLATMRSSYAEAEGHLLSALTILRAYSDDTTKSGFGSPSKTDPTKPRPDWTQEDPTVSRIVLGWAHLRLARAARDGEDEKEARMAFETVLERTKEMTTTTTARSVYTQRQVRMVAALSMLLLHLSDADAAARAGTMTSSTTQDSLTRHLVEIISTSSASDGAYAQTKLILSLTEAITAPTITASKLALSEALSLSNTAQANYVRMGILTLLANVFVCTRDRESQKMLSSAIKLSVAMGSHEARGRLYDKESGDGGKELVLAGSARFSLWCSERLLETYKAQGDAAQVRKQTRINELCRVLLKQDELDARAGAAPTAPPASAPMQVA